MKIALFSLAILASSAPARAADEIVALLDRYCLECHDNDVKKGGLSLESLKAFKDITPEVWTAIHEQVELGQMPPKKSDKPNAEERQTLLSWIRDSLRAGGHHVHHKLEMPNFGNFLPHERLFGVKPHPAPATPVRVWRQRPAAYRIASSGVQPFSLVPGQQISDFSALYSVDESSTEIVLRNAQQLIESWTRVELHDGELKGVAGGLPGLYPILHPEREPTPEQFAKAMAQVSQWAFDRAPSEDELTSLRQLYDKASAKYGRLQGGRVALTAPLLKPEAIYRLELGAGPLDEHGRRRLNKPEILTALTHTLSEGKPPQAIQTARAKPEPSLATREEVATLVRELLDGPRPNARLLVFFDEYFDYKKAVSVFKDVPQGIGGYSANQLVRETERLITHIVGEDRDVLRTLLTTNQAIIEPRAPQSNQTPTHRIYNLPADFKHRKGPVTLSSEERAGILTQPAWLIAHSTNFDNDPVRRGKWILEHLLGGTVPEVPVTVDAVVSRDQTRTLRDRLETVRTDAYCWKCHQQMNQLGMPFENFDQFGRYRLRELDGPVDTTGAIVTTGPVYDISDKSLDGEVANPIELIHRLAKSKRTQEVFVRYAFRFFLGRNETVRDAKTLQEASQAYTASGGSMKALVVSLLSSDSYLYRTPER
jgi:hypothetical protein